MPRRWDYYWEFWEEMLGPPPASTPEPVPEPVPTPEPPRSSLWEIEKQINRLSKEVDKRTGRRYLWV